MSITKVRAAITGNVTAQKMLDSAGESAPHGSGIVTDIEVDLGTATLIDVTIADKHGNIFVKTAIAADTRYRMDGADVLRWGIQGPLTVTTANISNSAHTATVTVWIKSSRGQ